MDNFRNTGVGFYPNNNQNGQNQNNSNKNRNRKNRNKNKNNQNSNMPLSPSKNSLNQFDYNSHSLDHQSFSNNRNNYNMNFNKFNNFNNHSNNQNQRKFNNNKYNKRRNGSQGNYTYQNQNNENYEMVNDRLNKSLTPNNSFGENSKISTSISLDNFDIVNALNSQKRSPIMPNSYSFMSSNIVITNQTTSPYKTTFNQQTTIIEQANLEDEVQLGAEKTEIGEEFKTDILSSITSTESLETSDAFADDTPLSCYSTPLNHDSSRLVDPDQSPRKHRENEEGLNQNDETPVKFEEDSSESTNENLTTVKQNDATGITTVSSNSSPDSKISETESQALVTASEGETSFGVDYKHNDNLLNENQTIIHSINAQLENMVVDKFNLDMNAIKSESNSNSEFESNKSVDGSESSCELESNLSDNNKQKQQQNESSTTSCSVSSEQPEQPEQQQELPEQQDLKQEPQVSQEHFEQNNVEQEQQKPQEQLEENKAEIEQQITHEQLEQLEQNKTELEHKEEIETEEQMDEEELLETEIADSNTKSFLEEQLEAEHAENLQESQYEIINKPKVEEIDLNDEERKQDAEYVFCEKEEENINIIPVMYQDYKSQTAIINTENETVLYQLDETSKNELKTINETIASIDSAKKLNALAQKDPVVDCFSCSIL